MEEKIGLRVWAAFGTGTFEGVLIYDEQVVHLHLFSEGCLMRCRAAGEQLAGAHAAGQSLGHSKIGHVLVLLIISPCGLRQPGTRRMNRREGEVRSSLGPSKGTHSLHQQRHVTCRTEAALLSNSINRRLSAVLRCPPELLPERDLCLHLWEKETT